MRTDAEITEMNDKLRKEEIALSNASNNSMYSISNQMAIRLARWVEEQAKEEGRQQGIDDVEKEFKKQTHYYHEDRAMLYSITLSSSDVKKAISATRKKTKEG